jgi:hypothetical protein
VGSPFHHDCRSTSKDMVVTYKVSYLNSKIQTNFHAFGMYLLVLIHFSHFALTGYYFISTAVRCFYGAYCISSSCRTTAVALSSLLPHEQRTIQLRLLPCVLVELSSTYPFTTLHHVIHTVCFLLVSTSITRGPC